MVTAPPPADDGVDEVAIVSGSGYDPARRSRTPRLHGERDGETLAALRALLLDWDPAPPATWMTVPELSFVLLRQRRPVAELGLLPGGTVLRVPGLPEDCDVRLARPEDLAGWLAARRISPPTT